MKFGKKRSPEPAPIDITERLSILDLRPSVRDGSATPIAEGIGAPQVVREPTPQAVAVAEAAPAAPPVVEPPATPAPVVLEPVAASWAPEASALEEPVAEEPAAETDHGPEHHQPAAGTGHSAPDPLAYELAAFELNLPAAALDAAGPSEPQDVPEPAPTSHHAEPQPDAVPAPQPPAWSYEQVARIEHAEQHVSAWVPPQAAPAQPVEEPAAEAPSIDLTEPAPEPAVDLAEHDPVFAAVEASQNQSRGDDGVIRWHW